MSGSRRRFPLRARAAPRDGPARWLGEVPSGNPRRRGRGRMRPAPCAMPCQVCGEVRGTPATGIGSARGAVGQGGVGGSATVGSGHRPRYRLSAPGDEGDGRGLSSEDFDVARAADGRVPLAVGDARGELEGRGPPLERGGLGRCCPLHGGHGAAGRAHAGREHRRPDDGKGGHCQTGEGRNTCSCGPRTVIGRERPRRP